MLTERTEKNNARLIQLEEQLQRYGDFFKSMQLALDFSEAQLQALPDRLLHVYRPGPSAGPARETCVHELLQALENAKSFLADADGDLVATSDKRIDHSFVRDLTARRLRKRYNDMAFPRKVCGWCLSNTADDHV